MERKPVVIAQEELAREAAVCGEIKAWWASRGRTPRAYVDTYGCQQNEADSERIRGMLRASGYDIVDTEEGADCIVINTCAIREHAETRVYGNVGALVHTKARHPEQKIFLCGCMMGQPQVVERIKNSYRHVDGVFNPHELWRFPELLQRVLKTGKRIFAVDDSAGNIAEGIPVVRSSNLKAWVSIMYGCNNFCSYCIVPYVRGRERSRRPEEILEEVKGLIAAGYKDITLLGQNVNSYGKDLGLGVDFADLMASIAELPGEFWLRFMTSHPKDASKKLFDTICICSRCIKYNNTFFCTHVNRNVVDTCTCTCDNFDILREFHVMHFCTSYQNCIGIVHVFCLFVFFTKQAETCLGNWIEAFILEHYAFSSSNFFMNATRASTPSFGIAL